MIAKSSHGRWFIAVSAWLMCCGKTESTDPVSGGGGATGGGGAAASGAFAGAGTGSVGGSGGSLVDAADADEGCGGSGAYANVCKCPEANCGPTGDGTWYCATAPCEDACPMPIFSPNGPCALGRACVNVPLEGCGRHVCVCDGAGWRCAMIGVQCEPACDQVLPGAACVHDGKICTGGSIQCACASGSWSCSIQDAG